MVINIIYLSIHLDLQSNFSPSPNLNHTLTHFLTLDMHARKNLSILRISLIIRKADYANYPITQNYAGQNFYDFKLRNNFFIQL